MRFWPYVLFVLLLGQLVPAQAQEATPLRRLEGSLTQTVQGATAKAQVAFESPASLKISIENSPLAGVPAQIILATGDETRLYEPLTHRVHRLPYNIAREWYRGWGLQSGGPANFAFANTPLPAKPATRWHRDAVLFGGSGDRVYYAANKSLQPLWPIIELGTTPTRREKDAAGTVLSETQVEWNTDKLPAKATTVADGVTSTFVYDLKTRADAFAADTFQLPAEAADAVVEEDDLKAASEYGGTDASSHFNRGTALAVGSEDYAAAITEWNQAGALAPKATAPALAIFEAAMTTRNLPMAADALAALATRNLDKAELAARRARLALAQRNYDLAQSSIDAAHLAAPQEFTYTLQRADILRQRGDLPNATAALLEILKTDAPVTLQIGAAESLAAMAGDDTLAKVPTDTEPQKLARTLILLNQGKDPETTDFQNDAALADYAAAQERAGHDTDAQTAWSTLETRAPLAGKNLARAHLIAIAARRGDTAASLRAFRDWNTSLTQESARTDARLTLFDAWQKAFKHDVLAKALQNRALGGAATNDDMRLWLAWQENYGQPEDVRSLVETGTVRFSNDAFWQSKRADSRVTEANDQPGSDAGLARREKLFREANQALDKAVSQAPEEPFYAMQRILVAVQRARPRTGVIDAGQNAANAATARAVFDNVEKAWPDDPDVAVTVALARLGLDGDAGAAPAQTRATAALNSPPGDGDRHTLIVAARQALGRVARRQQNLTALRRQFLTLINAAPTATEQAGLANALLSDFQAPEAPLAAALLTEIARQPWDYSEARVELDGVAGRTADIPGLGWPTLNVLQTQNDGASILAAVALTEALYDRAQKAINTPQAPPAADADFDRATNARNFNLPRLAQVATGSTPLLAGRATALLAENTVGADALKWIRQAVAGEPSDPALRLTLMDALLAAGDTDGAKQEFDTALRNLDLTPDARRRLALFALRINDAPLAYKLALDAYNDAALSPDVDANTFQRIAFATAHIAFANRQPARGLDIYNNLASPQWGFIDRTTALIALRNEYLAQGKQDELAKVDARFKDLQVTEDDYKAGQAFLESMAS